VSAGELAAAGCGLGFGRSSRRLFPPPRTRGLGRRFADQLSGHQVGDKLLHAVSIEIDRGAFRVGLGDHTEPVNLVLDVLALGENLHNFLL